MDEALPLTPLALVVAGVVMLFWGRRLFWLFVGLVGFLCGMEFGLQVFPKLPDWQQLLVALGAGVAAALLAVVLQRLAVLVAGGFVGAIFAMHVAQPLGLHTSQGILLAAVAGGLLSAVLLSILFDPALIVLSAVAGALMVSGALPLDTVFEPIVFLLLLGVGIYFQVRQIRSGSIRPSGR